MTSQPVNRTIACITLGFVLTAGCSGGDDDACIPNETETSGVEYRTCGSDGEWGPWFSNDEVFDRECIGPGTYLISKYGLAGNSVYCPASLPVEVMNVSSNGTLTADEPAIECIDSVPVTDGCRRTFQRECHFEDSVGEFIFSTDFSTGSGFVQATITIPGAAPLRCTYEILITRS